MSLQLRRGTNAERIRIVFAVGEIVYATDTKQIFVGDGTTAGGVEISPSRETIDYLENSAQSLDSGLEGRVLNIVDQDYINERARNSVSAGENLLYDSATGVFSSLVDSAFITAIVNEDYVNTFLNHDSDYIRSKIDQAFIDTFDTHDSGAIRAMIDIAVAANDQLDSAAIAYQIYNTVTQTFIDQFNTHDSLAVEGQINSAFTAKSTTDLSEGDNLYYTTARVNTDVEAQVNSLYVQTRVSRSFIEGNITQGLIDTFDTHDSAAVQGQINDVVDQTYVRNFIDQAFMDQFDTHDSAAVLGQINATVNQSFIDQFDTHDSAIIQAQIDVAIAAIDLGDAGLDSAAVLALVSATDTHDSAAVLGQITSTVDTAYVQARQLTYDFLDSSEALNLIDQTYVRNQIDQTFIDTFDTHDSSAVQGQINATVNQSFINQFDTHDSAAVQGQIDATIAATDTHDSAAVLGQITSTVDAAYVQARQLTYDFLDSSEALALIDATHVRGKIDQAFIDTFDTHDSATVVAQINATVNQSFIDTFDTHDSAAVQSQITSTVTESYVKNFADSAHVRSALSGGTGVTFNGNTGEISIGQDVGTSDNVTFNNVNISGDLNVTGTQTTLTSETLAVHDPLVRLAESNEQSDILDIGFIGHYYGDAARRHTGFFRDASNKEYYIFNGLIDSAFDSVPATNIVDRTKPGFTLATLNTGRIVGVYAGFDSDLGTKSTSDLSEGTNLYYTKVRVDSDIALKVDTTFVDNLAVNYSSLTGTPTFGSGLTDQSGTIIIGPDQVKATMIDFGTGANQVSTDDVLEGSSNLYYTDARVGTYVNTAYVQGKIDQSFINTFDTHDSVAVLGQINATVNQSFINQFDTHDSVAVQGQINSNFAAGFTVGGDITFSDSDDLILPDQSRIKLGSGGDLSILHTGVNGIITNNTGNLQLNNNQDNGSLVFKTDDGTGGITEYFKADGSTGEVKLYHYGSEKLATKSTGVEVTGTINTTDGYLMDGYNSFKFSANDSSSFAIGPHALQNWAQTTSGWNNIAIGVRTLRDQTGNGSNIAIGADAQREATGFFNVAVGRFSLRTNASNRNVAVGDYAAGEHTGQYGVAMGYSTMFSGNGDRNVALGAFSMSQGSGNYNTAAGYASLENQTTGELNVSVGYFAGNDLTTGFRNTVVGSYALDGATDAQENTVIGSSAMGNSTTGTKNVAVGRSAGLSIDGDFNTALGADAGTNITTGSNLTVVGYNAQPSSSTATNEVTLGDANVTTLRVPGAGFNVASGAGTFTGSVSATSFSGDGSALTNVNGATGGGTDNVFYENDQNVTANYTITTNKNAMTAGPITIDAGVTVTIPSGSEWSIV